VSKYVCPIHFIYFVKLIFIPIQNFHAYLIQVC